MESNYNNGRDVKIVVTGCLGFIGSHFVKYTLENYPNMFVVGFDRYTNEQSVERLEKEGLWKESTKNRFRMVYGDLTGDVKEMLADTDIVFNFGAKTHVDHSKYSPESFIQSNVLGPFNLLEAVRSHNQNTLFVEISTDEVYGQAEGEVPFSEYAMLKPTNIYSATKCAGDLIALAYGKTYGIEVLVTRCENNYGEFQHPQKVLPVYIRHALEGKQLPVYAPGTQKRKWLYVGDHCDAIWTLVEAGARGVCNIAGGEELENLELASKVMRFLETPHAKDRVEMIDTATIRPFHDKRYNIKATVLEALHWKPKMDLNDGLCQTIKWYKKNRRWLIP